MAYQVGDGNPDGVVIPGKVGFYGKTPSAQAATIAAVTTTGATTTSYGYTEAQANAIVANINAIRTALIDVGIIAAS